MPVGYTLEWGGVRLRITDSAGAERYAPLLYVSPAQINFLVPANVGIGPAVIAVAPSGAPPVTVSVQLRPTAPALFTMNQRLAAATAVRVRNGVQTPVAVFECGQAGCAAAPLELSADAPVFLTLYATGLRRLQSVSVTVRGSAVPVLYAGPQPTYPGLDQVNLELPVSLRGAGVVEIVLTVDGQPANPVAVSVR